MKPIRIQLHRRPVLMDILDREHIISKDEILNLKISLETSQDVLEFLADEHIFASQH